MPRLLTLTLLLLLPLLAHAQFGQFFEHMFSGGGSNSHGQQGGGGHSQRHHQQPDDVASDSSWYRQTYERAHCSKYLCPATLSCVDKPTHCPCAFPSHEEKFELHDSGRAICLSKSIGQEKWESVRDSLARGELSDTARKVRLARLGLL
ncbi:hypothetical protein DFH27DRAFT_559947 [Peziza echinospora]|nr:hypothetical protein DFH27DRAFT_559947 [Peziza echinospora]